MKTDKAAAHGFTVVSHFFNFIITFFFFIIFIYCHISSHVTEYCAVIGPALYRAAVSRNKLL